MQNLLVQILILYIFCLSYCVTCSTAPAVPPTVPSKGPHPSSPVAAAAPEPPTSRRDFDVPESSYDDLKKKDLKVITCRDLIRHIVPAETDGHELCVYEKGDPNAEHTIVLVHGRTWSSLPVFDLKYETNAEGSRELVNLSTMDLLVANGVRVFAVDLRGFGGTERDGSGWLTPSKAVLDLKSVLCWMKKKKGIFTPCLLGWSQGGLVTHLFAQRYPHAISSAIFYASIYDPKVVYHRNSFLYKPPQPLLSKTTMDMAVEDFTLHGSISDEAGG
jgi:alpha-beta hydrolase superfamily lysophospholipase